MFFWLDMRPTGICIDPGEFRAKEQNLSGIENPKQERYQRAGCAVRGSDDAAPQVETKQELTNDE